MSSAMNASNASLSLSVAGVTQAEIWIQNVLFYVILDIPAVIGNTLIVVGIVKAKNLHTFFFVLFAGHALGRTFFSLQMFYVAIYRICRTLNPNLTFLTALQCHTLHWMVYFCDSYNSVSLCILAIDRLSAICKPTNYHKLSCKMGVLINLSVAFCIIVSRLIPSYFVSESFSTVISCVNFLSPVPKFFGVYNEMSNLTLGLIGVGLYCILNIVIRVHVSMWQKDMPTDSPTQRLIQRHLKLLPLVNTLIIINVLFVVVAELLMLLSEIYQSNVATRFVVYGGNLGVLDRLFDCIVIIWRCKELQQAVKELFPFFSKVSPQIHISTA